MNDNTIILEHVRRRMAAAGITDATLSRDVLRLCEDGMILRLLAAEPVVKSFRRERLQRLIARPPC